MTAGPGRWSCERLVVRWLAQLAEYPAADGILTAGASIANLMALAVSLREKAGPRIRKVGLQSLSPDTAFVVYGSSDVHHSIGRAMDLLGLGTEGLVVVRTDDAGRMDATELGTQIRRDRSRGRIPLCVVATAGTSRLGAVNPLAAIAEICSDLQVWLHVNAAYGGFARLVPSLRELLSGLEQADSVTTDPHKWLGLPYDVGCLLLRDPGALGRSFGSRSPCAGSEFWEKGIEESRRFRALKVWACIKYLGREGYRERLERSMELTRLLRDLVEECPDLELLSPPQLSTLVFRYAPHRMRGGPDGSPGRDDELNGLNRGDHLLDRRLRASLGAVGGLRRSSWHPGLPDQLPDRQRGRPVSRRPGPRSRGQPHRRGSPGVVMGGAGKDTSSAPRQSEGPEEPVGPGGVEAAAPIAVVLAGPGGRMDRAGLERLAQRRRARRRVGRQE